VINIRVITQYKIINAAFYPVTTKTLATIQAPHIIQSTNTVQCCGNIEGN